MRCLYDALEIERSADDGQIKAAYRKAALRWHPDKNHGNHEAEERFKEIQNAYEVLSDKHERSWYDSHRTDILRQGTSHQTGGSDQYTTGQPPDDSINLFPYFSSTCFSGYKDDSNGFYGVYEELFASLARQEAEAAKEQNDADSRHPFQEPPLFGTSQAARSQVQAFYSFWTNFASCKSFSWADQYNPASAPNRKVRRLMEEENRKSRKAKRREFNETVRELATFVRKRDKRVAAYQAEDAQKKLEREVEHQKRKEEERKERLRRAHEFEEAAWAQAEADGAFDEEEDIQMAECYADELYCLACNKSFRSKNAFANHEKSKKHLERVEVLKLVLEEEEKAATVGATTEGEISKEGSLHSSAAEVDTAVEASEADDTDAMTKCNLSPEVEAFEGAGSLRLQADESESSEASSAGSEDGGGHLAALLRMQQQRDESSGRSARQPKHVTDCSTGNGHHDQLSEEGRAGEVASLLEANVLAEELHGVDLRGESADDGASLIEAQPKKARRRRKDKDLKQPANGKQDNTGEHEGANSQRLHQTKQKRKQEKQKGKLSEEHGNLSKSCSICGQDFASRTKLFQHIKQSGHAAVKL